MTNAREMAVYTEGTLGTAVDFITAIKIFTLLCIYTFGVIVSGYAIGASSVNLLGWIQVRMSTGKTEGTD